MKEDNFEAALARAYDDPTLGERAAFCKGWQAHANQSALSFDEHIVLRDLAQALAWQCFGECRGYSERLLSPIEALAAARDVLGIPAAQAAPLAAPTRAHQVTVHPIKEPYTLPEIEARIASHDYSAELLLQHAMELLRGRAGEDARPVGKLVVSGPLHEWHPESAAFDMPSGTYPLYATPQPAAQAAPAVPTDLQMAMASIDECRTIFEALRRVTGLLLEAKATLGPENHELRDRIIALTTQGASHE